RAGEGAPAPACCRGSRGTEPPCADPGPRARARRSRSPGGEDRARGGPARPASTARARARRERGIAAALRGSWRVLPARRARSSGAALHAPARDGRALDLGQVRPKLFGPQMIRGPERVEDPLALPLEAWIVCERAHEDAVP